MDKSQLNLGESSDEDLFPDPDFFTQLHLDLTNKTNPRVEKERSLIFKHLEDLDTELETLKLKIVKQQDKLEGI